MTFNISARSWAFGFRNWAAMVLALLAAFWLQLDSASSAAVCVGILALPTRGQALQKGLYRVGATVVGVLVSILITSLFSQARDLFVLAVAVWLGLCVFAAGLLEGNRAYGAVLSGYTVAIVAVGQIDMPGNVFLSGLNRGAAEVLGIIALAVVNDAFFAPDLFPQVLKKLEDARTKVHDFALRTIHDGSADPIEVAALLGTVTAIRADITALPNESVSGKARASAARTAALALVRQITAARVVAGTLVELGAVGEKPRKQLLDALDDGSTAATSALRRDVEAMPIRGVLPARLVARSAALVLLEQTCRTNEALADMRAGRGPTDAPTLPIFRSRKLALRNAIRAFLTVVLAAAFLIVGGWPGSSLALVQLAALVGISATNPNPRGFAVGAVAAMPLAALVGGVVQFLVLDGVDDFPLLALAMAPPIFAASLLMTSGNQRLFGVGFLVLVFFPIFLSPENPQSYDPQTFLVTALLSNAAVIGLFLCLTVLLPTSDAMRLRWIAEAGQDELEGAMTGLDRRLPPIAAFRDADRIALLSQLTFADEDAKRAAIAEELRKADLAGALRRLRFAADDPDFDLHAAGDRSEAERTMRSCDPRRLRALAAHVADRTDAIAGRAEAAARQAASAMIFAASLIERTGRFEGLTSGSVKA